MPAADLRRGVRPGPTTRALAAALLAAAANTLACPPYGAAALAWLVPGLLLVPCRGVRPWRAALVGTAFGVAIGAGITNWALRASLEYFDFHHATAAAFVVLVWVVYSGIPFGLLCLFYASAADRVPAPARAPLAAWGWAVADWLRTTLFTGMPWELLGHTQHRALGLVQIADLGGVYAVSFVIALASVAVAEVVRDRRREAPSARRLARRLAPAALLLAATLGYGRLALARHGAVEGEPSARVAIVQGNIPTQFRWQRSHMERTLGTYVKLTESTRPAAPDLVVWPENAVDFYLEREPFLRMQLARAAALAPAGLLIGSPRLASEGEARNSAQLLGTTGQILGRYDKQHLVPLAEASLFPTGAADASEPVYGPGPRAEPIVTAVGRLGTMICYEVLFPGLVRDLVRRGAQVLVNLSNDAWLDAGDGAALEQHFSMAVFRAIETRRDLVRVAGSGVSGFVDATGRVVATVPRETAGARVERVRLRTTLTPYVRWGDAWMVVFGAMVAAGLLAARRRGRPA